MTVTLEIPSDIESVITKNAAQQGKAVNDYVLTLVETGLDTEYEMSPRERDEEANILRERIQDRLSGDKGILLEDYWAEVLRKREVRTQYHVPENAA